LMHALGLAVESLPDRERTVVLLLQAGYTSSEIAQHLNVKPSCVSRIKRSAIVRLRIALGIVPASRPRAGVRDTVAPERAS
jgi:RNA polymerase sigma factor (sigma-70 family)